VLARVTSGSEAASVESDKVYAQVKRSAIWLRDNWIGMNANMARRVPEHMPEYVNLSHEKRVEYTRDLIPRATLEMVERAIMEIEEEARK
jgi:hypothetical protein